MLLSGSTVWLVFVALGLYYAVHKVLERKRMQGARLPPGPKELPIIGSAFTFAKEPHLIPTFNKWFKEYGNVVYFEIFGQKMVVISSERIANDLFAKRGNIYSDRGTPPALKVYSDGVSPALIDKTDVWRRQRRLMHALINITENVRYEPFMDIESKYTLAHLFEHPEQFDDALARYAYGIVSRSSQGIKTDSLDDPFVQEVKENSDFAFNCFRPDKYISNLIPFALKLPSWICSDFKVLDAARRQLHHSILSRQARLKQKLQEGTAPNCLQAEFLAHQQEYAVTDLEGASVFAAFMGAGTRSPHNALLEFVIVMMKYPEWMKSLQDELDEVVGSDRLPEFSDMPRLPTVRAVVKEAIRHRSVYAEIGIPHKSSQDDIYEGFFFPAGTVFHFNASAILTDPEMYPDGLKFNPARWLDPSFPTYKEPLTVYPNLQHFASFGFGRRACPGSNFTERSLTIMVARMAWACNIKPSVDPVTKKPVELNITYEPVANPRPYPFPAVIGPRSEDRRRLVDKLAQEARKEDILS